MNAYNIIINKLAALTGEDSAIRFLEEYIHYRVRDSLVDWPEYWIFKRHWSFVTYLINDMTWGLSESGDIYWENIYFQANQNDEENICVEDGEHLVLIGDKKRPLICIINDTRIYEMEHTRRKQKNKLAKIERT